MRKRLLQILIILLCAFCIVFYARYIKGSSRVEIIEMQVTCPDYIARVIETPMNENSTATFPILNVVELENEELLNKIQTNMAASSLNWMPEYFEELDVEGSKVNYSSNKYLSVENSYHWADNRYNYYFGINTTIDMETGEIVYLDDLIEIDEELAELILTVGTTMTETLGVGDDTDYAVSEDTLDGYEKEKILAKLQECCEPYKKKHWDVKTSFYIRHNRLCIKNLFWYQSEVYITLDKLEDKLKVPKW